MKKKSITKKVLREFAYLVGICFPLLIGLLIPLIIGHSFRFWTLWISIPIIFIGTFAPLKLKIIYKGWMFLGEILGWLNSRIILSFVFILVLIPISFFMKMFNYDPLRKKKNNLLTYKEYKKDVKLNLTRIF